MRLRTGLVFLLMVAVTAGCDPPPAEPVGPPAPSVTRRSVSPTPASSPSPTFEGSIAALDEADRARMTGVSWRPGCPVPLEDLRAVSLRFWGFDGRVHEGVLVVHADAARDMLRVFRDLFRHRFPLERIEPVDAYGADDNASMAANNTSAFNCRPATGSTSSWSEHAYGRAVDVNPIQNPWVPSSGPILPPEGEAYADRSDVRPGMIAGGDPVVESFASVGWSWGGFWSSVKDYQHFSASGR